MKGVILEIIKDKSPRSVKELIYRFYTFYFL